MKQSLFGALLLMALGAVAVAQDYSKYNTVVNAKQFAIDWGAFYAKANRMTEQTRKALPHYLDLAYGKDPKQRLDIYVPASRTKNAPVLIYLHGGGFKEGDRAHYGYIAEPYAKQGIITVVPSYRLTPAGFHYPAQADDARAVVLWLHKNIGKYGGNPNVIFLTGHSAGAILTADIGVDRSWLKEKGIAPGIIKGIVPISGHYDIAPGERPDYAPTRELEVRASALRHIKDPAPIAIVVYGSQEVQRRASSEALANALKAKGVEANVLALQGEDHKDTALSMGTAGSALFNAVLAMIRKGADR